MIRSATERTNSLTFLPAVIPGTSELHESNKRASLRWLLYFMMSCSSEALDRSSPKSKNAAENRGVNDK
jgi:hypothetical protein